MNAPTYHAFLWKGGTMTDLGTLGTGTGSYALLVSSNGSVVAGNSNTILGNNQHGFRWTGGTMTDLGTLGTGTASSVVAMTPDGSVIVGNADTSVNYGSHAFRWTNGTMTNLGALGTGTGSSALLVSTDGSVVAGESYTSFGSNQHAFRWAGGTMTDLGTLGTGTTSNVIAMTPDGSVLVGNAATIGGGNPHAFRWTGGTLTDLGTLGTGTSSSATLVSTDGSVVAGVASLSNLSNQAFRWTATTGMVNLNTRADAFTGSSSSAIAMNSTGKVIVGNVGLTAGTRAFRWTDQTGMQTIEEWLTASGVTVAPTFHSLNATGVSDDGAVVIGYDQNDLPFLARGTGLISLADLQTGMAATANTLSLATDAGWTMLNGAHGHPLSRRAEAGHITAWAAGDLGEDDHASRDGSVSVGEVGAGYNFGTVQTNLALGKTISDQNTPTAGRTDLNGTYLITDIITKVPDRPLYVTLTGFYQWSGLDVRRGYLNAGLPDSSSASFEAHTLGGALRVDWENAASVCDFDLTPYLKTTIAQTRTPTFTESGGGFPATISGRKDLATEAALGVNSSHPLPHGLTLVNTLEWVHRFQDTSAATTADFGTGIGSVTTPGQRQRQDWLRVSAGVEYRTDKGLLSVSLNGTTVGQTSNLWVATSYQVFF